jgi:hypothetical protein
MDEAEYLMSRAERELTLAQAAELHSVAVAHYQLANAYLDQVEAMRLAANDGASEAARAAS